MAKPSISLPDPLLDRVDDARSLVVEGKRFATCDRSQWIREAIRLRLALEEADDWEEIMAEYGVSVEDDDDPGGEVPIDA